MNPLESFNQFLTSNPALLPIISIWSLVWKGFALWFAARNKQRYWFVPLLAVNLLGIPEIVYLLFFQKEGKWIDKIKKPSKN